MLFRSRFLQRANGIGIRAAYDQTVDALKKSRGALGTQLAMQSTRDQALAKRLESMASRKQALDFKGYNDMVSAYFEAMARARSR